LNNYNIVPGRPEHLPALADIELDAAKLFPAYLLPPELSGHTVSPDALQDGLTDRLLWVAVGPDGSAVGFILLSALDAIIFIKEIDVHPHHQQQGLGRALISTALAAARQRGFDRAALTTFCSVPWNAPFYKKLGFTTLEHGNMPAVIRKILDNERDAGLKDRVAMIKDLQKGHL
jgi:GNAT superfamily N-acetyltransferase